MKETLKKIIISLELLNGKLKTPLINQQEKGDFMEEIKDYVDDLANLQKAVTHVQDVTHKNTTECLVKILQNFGNIIQDLENMNEIITVAIQRYADKFLKE